MPAEETYRRLNDATIYRRQKIVMGCSPTMDLTPSQRENHFTISIKRHAGNNSLMKWKKHMLGCNTNSAHMSNMHHPCFATPSDAPSRRREFRMRMRIAINLAIASCAFAGLITSAKAQEIKPFKLHVDDSVVKDLKERLAKTRWPDQIPGVGWDYGVDSAYMKQLVEYWRTKYDWRRHERALNEFPQFTTEIDGIQMHFIHQRSRHTNALPLVIVHGWPGSVYEFHKIIGMLTEPENHGGKAEDAFHVVCPSLPGFGFSGKPAERGWSSQRMAETIAKLMSRLGYSRYGAQGGDWGSGIARWLAGGDGGHCIGAHSNFPGGNRPTEDPMRGVTQAEMYRFTRRVQ
jgi:hypothetical protein